MISEPEQAALSERTSGSESDLPLSTHSQRCAERGGYGVPRRYGAIAAGSALLMLGSAASVPLGPAASTAGRELLTLAASAAGMLLLIGACLPVSVPVFWREWYTKACHLVLGGSVVLAFGTLVTFAGGIYLISHSPASDTYFTDIVSFTHVDAELALSGRNPYTSDEAFREAIARFPYGLATPLRGHVFGRGFDHPVPADIAAIQQRYVQAPAQFRDAFDLRTLHSYPALSFLVYVPFLWAGVPNILLLHIVVYWALFAWLVWRTPIGWRHWGALAALAAMPTMAASLLFGTELFCILLVLAAWHFRDRLWFSAILLGLACAYKQYSWFFIPLLMLDVLLTYGWREALRRSAIVLGAFLVPNLPYLIASPHAWFASLWLPMTEPLFATGTGIIALAIGHIVPYGAPALYAGLEVVALGAVLWIYARWRQRLGESTLVLALVPLFFAFRSSPDYFGFAPWLAIYAAQALYPRRAPWSPSPLARAEVDERVIQQLAPAAWPVIAAGETLRGWARGLSATMTAAGHALLDHAQRVSQRTLDCKPARRVRTWIERQPGGRAGRTRRLVTFLGIGGLGTVVNLACFSTVYYALPSVASVARWPLAFIAGTEVSIVANFLLNDWLTFRGLPGHGRLWAARCLPFHVTSLVGVLVTFVISYSLHWLSVQATLAQAAGILVATAFNFVFHHVFTYGAPRHSDKHDSGLSRARAPAGGDRAAPVLRVRVGIRHGGEQHDLVDGQHAGRGDSAARQREQRSGGGRHPARRTACRSTARG